MKFAIYFVQGWKRAKFALKLPLKFAKMPNLHKIAKIAKFLRQNEPNLSNFIFGEFSGKLSKMRHLPKIAKIRNSGQKMSTFNVSLRLLLHLFGNYLHSRLRNFWIYCVPVLHLLYRSDLKNQLKRASKPPRFQIKRRAKIFAGKCFSKMYNFYLANRLRV